MVATDSGDRVGMDLLHHDYLYASSKLVKNWRPLVTACLSSIVVNPVTSQTLNYAPVATGAVFLYAVTTWLLSARKCRSPP